MKALKSHNSSIHPLPLVRVLFQLQAIPAMMRAGVSPGQGYFFFLKKAFQVTGMLSDIKLLKGHSSVSFWFYSWVCSTQNNPLSSSEVSICLFADFKIRMWGWRWLEPKCSLNENEKNFHTSSEKMMQKRLIITDIYLFIYLKNVTPDSCTGGWFSAMLVGLNLKYHPHFPACQTYLNFFIFSDSYVRIKMGK